jgi:acetyltransferase-like isoleucine patch superfamily enzyme
MSARDRIRAELAELTGPLALHALWRRAAARGYARLAARELVRVGAGATIEPSVRFTGTRRVSIGAGANVGAGVRMNTDFDGEIRLGDRVYVGPNCVLNSSTALVLGDGAMLAANCFVSTQRHAFGGDGPIRDQGPAEHAPVTIGPGAWLASNVVVTPGVTIGAGAVIGANSVVTRDVPPRHVAAGAPVRILREF